MKKVVGRMMDGRAVGESGGLRGGENGGGGEL